MPCTAKKFEAKQPKFAKDGRPEVDHVLTTQELAHMIEEAGIRSRRSSRSRSTCRWDSRREPA